MGIAKRVYEQKQELEQVALDILVEIGCLKECENHDGVFFDASDDLTPAYKVANSRISQGLIYLPSDMIRRDFSDLITDVYNDNAGLDGCPICERNLRDD